MLLHLAWVFPSFPVCRIVGYYQSHLMPSWKHLCNNKLQPTSVMVAQPGFSCTCTVHAQKPSSTAAFLTYVLARTLMSLIFTKARLHNNCTLFPKFNNVSKWSIFPFYRMSTEAEVQYNPSHLIAMFLSVVQFYSIFSNGGVVLLIFLWHFIHLLAILSIVIL